ncbi:MAG: ATP-binding cassette domain-containing protein [Bacilli bacterium]|nr:ATP-binding cassette domain-containing protein [Bacilli bacterium]MBR1582019.1 ATP-binding cassette domain-containing protein [Bacilli bacterium]
MSLVRIKNLVKIYKTKNNEEKALDIDNLSFPKTGMFFISGNSGSGKSTLINLLGGLDSITSGSIEVNGLKLEELNENELNKYRSSIVSFVFQDFYLLEQLTVYENVTFLLSKDEENNIDVDKLLKDIGLYEHKDKKPSQLSGGQKQRVAIARGVAKSPKILLCDEPTGNLDKVNSKKILEILKVLSQKILVIVVSHKEEECNEFADHIIYLDNGKISNAPHDDEETFEKCKLVKNKIPPKNLFKLFKSFLFNKRWNSIFTIVLVTVLGALFFDIQGFLKFNINETLKDEFNKNGVNQVQLLSGDITTNYYKIGNFSLKEIDDISKSLTNNKAYPVYSQAFLINQRSRALPYMDNNLYYPYGSVKGDTIGLRLSETYGTLVADEEYLEAKFGLNGKYEVLAGDIEKCKNEDYLIATDFFADSVMYLNELNSYEEVLGPYYQKINVDKGMFGKIGAIIKTDYKEKYKDLLKKNENTMSFSKMDLKDMEFIKFSNDIQTRLGLTYSLNPNYQKYIDEGILSNYFSFMGIAYENKEKDIFFQSVSAQNRTTIGIGEKRNMPKNTAVILAQTYNKYFEKNYPTTSKMTPLKEEDQVYLNFIKYKHNDPTKEIIWQKEFKIIGVSSCTSIDVDSFKEMQKYDIEPFQIAFKNNNDLSKIIDIAASNPKINVNLPSSLSVNQIGKLVDSFVDLFKILQVLVILLVIVFYFNYSIKAITSNTYEIGVMKALGASDKELSSIFILKGLVVSILGVLGSLALGALIIPYTDKVLVNSLTSFISGFNFKGTIIKFIPNLIAIDLGILLVATTLLSIIALILFKFIKPIKIIKSKD